MHGLSGKTVLITGAARRIGRTLALAMADAGADVAITYLNSEREAHQTLADLKARGSNALLVRCDVRNANDVTATLEQIIGRYGGLDILVNNAAVYETVGFSEITLEQWDRMFETNTRGPFLVTRAAEQALRERKGRVINIGSLGGLRPWAAHAHYCASKAALIMLTQIMAKALAPDVAVNCVAPGMISTGENREEEFVRHVAAKTPMRRAGTPEDVAEAVLFFATATPFITGQILSVDGGLILET